jgi:hypothetical protein
MRLSLLWSVAGAMLFVALPAFAQESDAAARATARKLGNAGVDAYNAGDFPAAADKLDKAYKVLQAPSLGLWSARAFVKNGRLVEASERYVEVSRLAIVGGNRQVQEQAKEDAHKEHEALAPRIPSLVVRLEGATPEQVAVSVDGKPLPPELIGESAPANPGAHKVTGVRGDEKTELNVTLAEGSEQVAILRFKPQRRSAAPVTAAAAGAAAGTAPGAATPTPSTPPPDEAPPKASSSGSIAPVLGWIGVGLGGATIVAGGITGAMAIEKKADLIESGDCEGGCDESSGRYRNFETLRNVSTICFISGGIVAATGIVLLVLAPSDDPDTVSFAIGPGHAGVRGSF